MGRGKSFDEEAALSSALVAFSSSGYAGTSVDDLMRATSLGKGSLYGTFGNKSALFARAFDAYCELVDGRLKARLAGPDQGALERLRDALGVVAETAGPSDVIRGACFLAKATAERAATDPAIAERARSTLESMTDTFAACIEQAQGAGDVDRDHDARRLAHFVVAIHRGLEAVAETGIDPAVLQDAADVTMSALRAPASAPKVRAAKRRR
jgi:TetR/AcrR family transcriptional repressor of nem operon